MTAPLLTKRTPSMSHLCDHCGWLARRGCTCPDPVTTRRLAADVARRHRDAVARARHTDRLVRRARRAAA